MYQLLIHRYRRRRGIARTGERAANKTLLKLSNDDTSRNLLGTELAKLAKV
jgi:hypothetical protein